MRPNWIVAAVILLGLGGTAACLSGDSGDFFPPTVEIVSPEDGATVSGVVDITVEATDDTGVEIVQFYRGTTLIGEDQVPPFSWLMNTTTLPDGPIQIEARARDPFGNTAFHRITVTVDNTPE